MDCRWPLATINSVGKWFTAVWEAYYNGLTAVVAFISLSIGRLGGVIARRPWVVIALSLTFIGLCSLGWMRFHTETRADHLWIKSRSQTLVDRQWVKATYGLDGGWTQVFATVSEGGKRTFGEDVLQPEATLEMFRVHEAIMATRVEVGGRSWGFKDICHKKKHALVCVESGYLSIWNSSVADYQAGMGAPEGPGAVGAPHSRERLISFVSRPTYPGGEYVKALAVYGGMELSSDPLAIKSARALAMDYRVSQDSPADVTAAWYSAYQATIAAQQPQLRYIQVTYISGRSVDDEVGRSVTQDLPLVGLAGAVFAVTSVLGLTRPDRVRTRSTLGLLGLACAALGMMAGYGLAMAMNLPFTTLQQTLPYVLLGVAVDVMFILVKSYNELEMAASAALTAGGGIPRALLPVLFSRLMSGAGTSVAVTTLASAVAYALGTLVPMPCITWFSAYAVLSVVCICITQLTLFIALFCLTERRIGANRFDLLCCFKRRTPNHAAAAGVGAHHPASKGAAPAAGRWRDWQLWHRIRPSGSDAGGVLPCAQPPPGGVAATKDLVGCLSLDLPSKMTTSVHASGSEDGELIMSNPGRDGSGGGEPVAPLVLVMSPLPECVPPNPTSSPLKAAPDTLSYTQEALITSPRISWGRNFMRTYYAPALLWWPSKVAVVLLFTAAAVLSGVAIPHLRQGQPVEQIAPDTSYLQDFVRVLNADFLTQAGYPTDVYFRGFDPASPAAQAKMAAALNSTLSLDSVNATLSAMVPNWLTVFSYFAQEGLRAKMDNSSACFNPYQANPRVMDPQTPMSAFLPATPPLRGCVPEKSFYKLLHLFVRHPDYAHYASNLRWDASGRINSSYATVVHAAQPNGFSDTYTLSIWKDRKAAMAAMNGDVFAEETAAAGRTAFLTYNDNYIYYEGDAVLATMTLEYAGLAVAGVGAVLLVMLVHPCAAGLMMAAVALVMLYLFGEMFLFGIRFNQVSVINMIMATGLAVDYSVYPAHKFMTTPGPTRDARVTVVLTEYGVAIFLGGLTALLGTVPLAFGSSAVLRTFFSLMFGTIVFSLLVGMVLMPVLFSLVGPAPLARVVHAQFDPVGFSPSSSSGGGGSESGRSSSGGGSSDSYDTAVEVPSAEEGPWAGMEECEGEGGERQPGAATAAELALAAAV